MAEEENEQETTEAQQPEENQQATAGEQTEQNQAEEQQPEQDQQTQVAESRFAEVTDTSQDAEEQSEVHRRNLEMLYEIPVTVSVRLGETEMSIRDLLDLRQNSVIELEKVADEDVDLLINGVHVGKGDVVVVNDKFGLRITEITSKEERLKNI